VKVSDVEKRETYFNMLNIIILVLLFIWGKATVSAVSFLVMPTIICIDLIIIMCFEN